MINVDEIPIQGPRTSRCFQSVPFSQQTAPPMTVIDPQREAYLKAVVERERYFYSHVHPHYCPSTDLRAYEVESNLPDKVLSALEEKNRLRSLWQSCSSPPPQPPCPLPSSSSSSHPTASSDPSPAHFGQESISNEAVFDFHGDDCQVCNQDDAHEVGKDDGSCMVLMNSFPVDLIDLPDFSPPPNHLT
ncbi:hypothetical protein VP01_312g1 [Puccinia sorghi]|uniref:Uncharacterized protein n=1 Tax=Puccinia sorghi TaxID=27349 RepID=A0A0L6UZW7_9BASI|nr:hypothetical protein VP01_312g1 [Puccinia sorghi]